jgi:hypothetical protein
MIEAFENILLWLIIGVLATLIGIYHREIISVIINILRSSRLETRKCGIISIYENRHTLKARKAIKKAIKKADGVISLIGVAFPDFFRPGSDIMEIIGKKLEDPTFTLRILLLNPHNEYAKERAGREKGDFTIKDIEQSIMFLEEVSTRARIIVHTYNIPPIVYAIITDKCVFAEQYLYALPKTDLACMGGQVPFLECKKDSDFNKVVKQHFEYMWHNKSEEIINRGGP